MGTDTLVSKPRKFRFRHESSVSTGNPALAPLRICILVHTRVASDWSALRRCDILGHLRTRAAYSWTRPLKQVCRVLNIILELLRKEFKEELDKPSVNLNKRLSVILLMSYWLWVIPFCAFLIKSYKRDPC